MFKTNFVLKDLHVRFLWRCEHFSCDSYCLLHNLATALWVYVRMTMRRRYRNDNEERCKIIHFIQA